MVGSASLAETDVSSLLYLYGTSFTNLAGLHCVTSNRQCIFPAWVPDTTAISKLRINSSFVGFLSQMLWTFVQYSSQKT